MIAMLAALSACGPAGAQPEPVGASTVNASGIHPPAGWQALPSVAAAARTAAGAGGVTVDGVEAWGDPAMGCYAVWLALHGAGGGPEALAEQILAGLAAEKVTASEVVQPGSEPVLVATLERAPYRGKLRARLGDGRISALACLANPREPLACAAACAPLLGAVP